MLFRRRCYEQPLQQLLLLHTCRHNRFKRVFAYYIITERTTSEPILLIDPACVSPFIMIRDQSDFRVHAKWTSMSQTSMFLYALFQLEKSLWNLCGHRWKSNRRADNDARSVCETVCPQGALIMGRQTHPQAPLDPLPWRTLDVWPTVMFYQSYPDQKRFTDISKFRINCDLEGYQVIVKT